MDHKDLYKATKIPKLADALTKRSRVVALNRQEKQRDLFWEKRNISKSSPIRKSLAREKKSNLRAELFKEWKKNKLKKLEEDKKKKKPIFKVGIVQKSATGSPLLSKKNIKDCNAKNRNTTNKKNQDLVSESKSKYADYNIKEQKKSLKELKVKEYNVDLQKKFCKVNNGVVSSLESYEFKPSQAIVKSPCNMLSYQKFSPTAMKNKFLNVTEPETIDSINLDNTMCDKKKFEETSLKKIKKPFTSSSLNVVSHNNDNQLIYYSPYVTGREDKKSNKENNLDLFLKTGEETEKESNEFQSKIFLFRNYIDYETKKLLSVCTDWKNLAEKTSGIPSDVEGEIISVIGKTNLLTSDKFAQFQNLIDKCEKKDPLVNLNDLQGFQDWVSIEVKKINNDFEVLEKKKNNNWILDAPHIENKKPKRAKHNKAMAKPLGKSNIRNYIEAFRKKMKDENVMDNPPNLSPNML